MNLRFETPFDQTASSGEVCGTVTVEGDGNGGGGMPTPPGTDLPADPAIIGGGALLALIVVALLVI